MEDNIQTGTPGRKEIIESVEMNVVSAGKRFANMILDIVFLYVVAFFVGIILGIMGLISIVEVMNGYLFGIVLVIVYYAFFEGVFGKSPAKFITRTRVVTEIGEKPDFATILGRTLCRFIPFEAFSFLGGDPVGWHDSISKTRVIHDKPV